MISGFYVKTLISAPLAGTLIYMETDLASAVLKLAEVHDRRLGEIGSALSRLADALEHKDDLAVPDSGIDHLARQVEGLASEIRDGFERLKPDEG